MKKLTSLVLILVFVFMFGFSGMLNPSVVAAEVAELKVNAVDLNLADSIYIKFFVKTTANLELLVWREGVERTMANADKAEVVGTDGGDTVFAVRVVAKEMADNIYVKATNGVNYGAELKYSVVQYAIAAKARVGIAQEKIDLLDAMLDYGAAAQTFFNHNKNRLANGTFHTIKVVGGTLADGTTRGLFADGESVTVKAPANNGAAAFANWNCGGSAVAETEGVNEYTFTATQSATYEAVYGAVGETETVNCADFSFGGGAVTVSGALNVSEVNFTGAVKPMQVSYKGTTALVDAYVTYGGQYGTYQFDDYTTPEAMNAFMNEGFSVEAFYVMPNKSVDQGIVCAAASYTVSGVVTTRGWGLAQNDSGRPYFISGTGVKGAWSQTPNAGAVTPVNDLVHVVAVYEADPVNAGKYKESVYVNGVLYQTASNLVGIANAAGTDSNKFCIGAGYAKPDIGSMNQGMVMVDAKIYAKALDAKDVATVEASAAKLVTDNAVSVTAPTPAANTPTPYADIDFDLGFAYDRLGKVNTAVKGAPTFGKTNVAIAGGNRATLDAMNVNSANGGQYVLCNFIPGSGFTNMTTFVNGGFSVEAFYVASGKDAWKSDNTAGTTVGVICAIENDKTSSGWGIAETTGQPYFCTGHGNATSASYSSVPKSPSKTSTTELVHVVAVYDASAKIKHLYVNGVEVGSGASFAATFNPIYTVSSSQTTPNYFCLGADLYTSKVGEVGNTADFMSTSFTMVDAKIYNSVLTSAQVTATYQNATAPFAAASPDPMASASGVYADLYCL